jgi:hypothetical protein
MFRWICGALPPARRPRSRAVVASAPAALSPAQMPPLLSAVAVDGRRLHILLDAFVEQVLELPADVVDCCWIARHRQNPQGSGEGGNGWGSRGDDYLELFLLVACVDGGVWLHALRLGAGAAWGNNGSCNGSDAAGSADSVSSAGVSNQAAHSAAGLVGMPSMQSSLTTLRSRLGAGGSGQRVAQVPGINKVLHCAAHCHPGGSRSSGIVVLSSVLVAAHVVPVDALLEDCFPVGGGSSGNGSTAGSGRSPSMLLCQPLSGLDAAVSSVEFVTMRHHTGTFFRPRSNSGGPTGVNNAADGRGIGAGRNATGGSESFATPYLICGTHNKGVFAVPLGGVDDSHGAACTPTATTLQAAPVPMMFLARMHAVPFEQPVVGVHVYGADENRQSSSGGSSSSSRNSGGGGGGDADGVGSAADDDDELGGGSRSPVGSIMVVSGAHGAVQLRFTDPAAVGGVGTQVSMSCDTWRWVGCTAGCGCLFFVLSWQNSSCDALSLPSAVVVFPLFFLQQAGVVHCRLVLPVSSPVQVLRTWVLELAAQGNGNTATTVNGDKWQQNQQQQQPQPQQRRRPCPHNCQVVLIVLLSRGLFAAFLPDPVHLQTQTQAALDPVVPLCCEALYTAPATDQVLSCDVVRTIMGTSPAPDSSASSSAVSALVATVTLAMRRGSVMCLPLLLHHMIRVYRRLELRFETGDMDGNGSRSSISGSGGRLGHVPDAPVHGRGSGGVGGGEDFVVVGGGGRLELGVQQRIKRLLGRISAVSRVASRRRALHDLVLRRGLTYLEACCCLLQRVRQRGAAVALGCRIVVDATDERVDVELPVLPPELVALVHGELQQHQHEQQQRLRQQQQQPQRRGSSTRGQMECDQQQQQREPLPSSAKVAFAWCVVITVTLHDRSSAGGVGNATSQSFSLPWTAARTTADLAAAAAGDSYSEQGGDDLGSKPQRALPVRYVRRRQRRWAAASAGGSGGEATVMMRVHSVRLPSAARLVPASVSAHLQLHVNLDGLDTVGAAAGGAGNGGDIGVAGEREDGTAGIITIPPAIPSVAAEAALGAASALTAACIATPLGVRHLLGLQVVERASHVVSADAGASALASAYAASSSWLSSSSSRLSSSSSSLWSSSSCFVLGEPLQQLPQDAVARLGFAAGTWAEEVRRRRRQGGFSADSMDSAGGGGSGSGSDSGSGSGSRSGGSGSGSRVGRAGPGAAADFARRGGDVRRPSSSPLWPPLAYKVEGDVLRVSKPHVEQWLRRGVLQPPMHARRSKDSNNVLLQLLAALGVPLAVAAVRARDHGGSNCNGDNGCHEPTLANGATASFVAASRGGGGGESDQGVGDRFLVPQLALMNHGSMHPGAASRVVVVEEANECEEEGYQHQHRHQHHTTAALLRTRGDSVLRVAVACPAGPDVWASAHLAFAAAAAEVVAATTFPGGGGKPTGRPTVTATAAAATAAGFSDRLADALPPEALRDLEALAFELRELGRGLQTTQSQLVQPFFAQLEGDTVARSASAAVLGAPTGGEGDASSSLGSSLGIPVVRVAQAVQTHLAAAVGAFARLRAATGALVLR